MQRDNGGAVTAEALTGAALEAGLGYYREMLLVRSVEGEIESLHRRGRMHGSFHSSMGQEACAVGVCASLRLADIVTSTHRGHGHAIAKGVTAHGMIAELFGRSTGVSGGRGGSMHLHQRATGFYGENAIVAGGLPWAAGAAWARKRAGTDDIAVAFMGDGGFAQGVTHEVLTMARYWESPLLIVCENNGLAHSMPADRLWGDPGRIASMVAASGVRSEYVDGTDVFAVAEVARGLVEHVRTGQPAFLECGVFRVRPHSISDADYLYRSRTAGQEWMDAHDPLAKLRGRLGPEAGERLDAIDRDVAAEVAAASAQAEADPLASTSDATRNLYTTPELAARA
ncbi:thiamine pyrophosphate-dependent dehydrogenase E1 component subunit alpha [Conexibacter sp. CPCC 206217]|uniref:thiamine pyrophosphate-dependent dehydrogenase E1 component subunit alpha n=1 Tax=Conexibacter sp. CPCC 206217 TaxID=3064574 RepID=UPI002720CE04|nr:thiamine pyrophosphate-dependent dehydrogenase E1 component subunit alpha [Conexibacter sp. CPCC 206217]MDO8209562.1 thiamine pyrophosphate-dependent dehydrogenase E1 component subunit alpha [Conexibacter sp. CPCC 206217]